MESKEIYLVEDYVKYEGGKLLAAYDNEEAANAHKAHCDASDHTFDMSYHVRTIQVESAFVPPAVA